MICSIVEAKDSVQWVTAFLEGLKDVESDQEGTLSSFTASRLWFFFWLCDVSGLAALTVELMKALSEEKAARSAADRALAEEKATQQAVEQSLMSSNEANTLLTKELDSSRASLTTTTEKLSSKSFALDHAVIQEKQMKIWLTACEDKLMACEAQLTVANDKLMATEEKVKIQGQLLDLAQQSLSKWELSSTVVISSVVASVVALMKNHLPNLYMEILCNDFIVDDAGREALVNSRSFRIIPSLCARASDASVLPMVWYLLELFCEDPPAGATMMMRRPSSVGSPHVLPPISG
jgi:hypothetical protein